MPSLVFRCVIFANAAWSSSRSSSRPENAALSLLTAHQAVPVPRSARAARPSACDERRQAGRILSSQCCRPRPKRSSLYINY